MSGENLDVKLQLKVMVNKERNKVLYAVADNHFADILLSFLTLPMGRVVKVLEKYYGDKAPTFGSLNSLYRSLENLDSLHFVTEGAKKALIDPMSSFEDEYGRLKLDITDSPPAVYFYCTKCFRNRFRSVSMYYDTPSHCHICSSYSKMSKEVLGKRSEASTGDGAFTIHKASSIISDDLVAGKTGIKAIDNLYRSTTDLLDDKYFNCPDSKKRLIKPNLLHGCISKDYILPLTEERLPSDYSDPSLFWSAKFPKGQGRYLDGPTTYLVTDDLVVTPFCIVCSLSYLRELKVPISDVKEVELEIGMKEALSIQRASFTSTSALTDALHPRNFMKQPKLEREF